MGRRENRTWDIEKRADGGRIDAPGQHVDRRKRIVTFAIVEPRIAYKITLVIRAVEDKALPDDGRQFVHQFDGFLHLNSGDDR